MDQVTQGNALQAPSQPKAPGFFIDGKRGRTILPAVVVGDFDTAIREFKSTASVETQMSRAITVICHIIAGHPNEMKAEPTKENAAGKVIAEVETAMFGKKEHRGKLPGSWSTVKSRYLAHYRKHGAAPEKLADGTPNPDYSPLWVERDGQKFAKPYRVVDTELANDRAATAKSRDEKFLDVLAKAIGEGLTLETVESAIATLEGYRTALESGAPTEEGMTQPQYEVLGGTKKL